MSATSPILLITGPEELLLRREADRVLAAHREAVGGELDVIDLRAPELGDAALPDLRTGSLFGTPRAVVVREAQALPAAAAKALIGELDGTPPEALVVLLATSLGRIQALAKRVKEAGGRIDVAPPREYEDAKWHRLIADELARHERRIDDAAVAALFERAGSDVGVIAEKAAQLAAGAPPGTITAGHVDELVVGHGNRGSFAIADAMCERDPATAVTRLRGALEHGDEPVMLLGALAYRLRTLVAVAWMDRLPRSRVDELVELVDDERREKARQAQERSSRAKGPDEIKLLASDRRPDQISGVILRFMGLKISPPMAGRLRGFRRNFGPGELTTAYRVLADADAEMKGGELSAEMILERAVIAIADRDLDAQPRRVVPAVSRTG